MLIVTIYSFSYRRGIPCDASDNGGGFVFDCRALHNPGRYDQYKMMNGLDEPVKEFLRKESAVDVFLDAVKTLVVQAIDCYLKRDFTNLMISFGCTGGQHRSVYCAQWIADYLRDEYPQIKVNLIHREQEKK